MNNLSKAEVREKLKADTAKYLKEHKIELIAAQPIPSPFNKRRRPIKLTSPRELFYQEYINHLSKEYREFIGVPTIKQA